MFDLVVIADWSAALGRKPEPCEDRCWLAWGTRDERSEPHYAPTRIEAGDRLIEVLNEHARARVLVGIDASIGLPVSDEGAPHRPTGRAWIEHLAQRISDDRSGHNNRFDAAAELNRELRQHTGAANGPFWGRPREVKLDDLPEKRPADTRMRKLRACEIAARRATKTKPKSPWQLTGAGSVGSQGLMAAPLIHRLLTDTATRDRAVLWPFDDVASPAPDAVVIAEVYPSMYPRRAPSYWYRDARQVCDTRDAILESPPTTLAVDHPLATVEGWILGVPVPAAIQDDEPAEEPITTDA